VARRSVFVKVGGTEQDPILLREKGCLLLGYYNAI